MNQFIHIRWLIVGLFLLPVLTLAQTGPDTVQPPLRSTDELIAWMQDPNRPKVRLHPLPSVAPPPEPSLAPDKEHVLALIAQLAAITDPDYGFSPTLSGSRFAPIPGSENTDTMLLTDPGLKQSPAVLELVKLGPRALPFLLTHLDDATPTKLSIENHADFGQILADPEIDFNEASPVEQTLRKGARRRLLGWGKPLPSRYRVKVGDICFIILGQIVGRDYLAVRYQPSGLVIVNSPVGDKKLAQEVRAVWASHTPTRHLFRSLLTDYSCRGVYGGSLAGFGGWDRGSDLQCRAAMRLLYYFPKETAALIAARLHHLRVERVGPAAGGMAADKEWTDQEMAAREKRDVANGVRTDEFVRAVSWCREPRIQTEIAAILKRTGDPDVITAARSVADASGESSDIHKVREGNQIHRVMLWAVIACVALAVIVAFSTAARKVGGKG